MIHSHFCGASCIAQVFWPYRQGGARPGNLTKMTRSQETADETAPDCCSPRKYSQHVIPPKTKKKKSIFFLSVYLQLNKCGPPIFVLSSTTHVLSPPPDSTHGQKENKFEYFHKCFPLDKYFLRLEVTWCWDIFSVCSSKPTGTQACLHIWQVVKCVCERPTPPRREVKNVWRSD